MIVPEMMDRPGLDVRQHVRALDALGLANSVSRTAAAIWPAIREAARDTAGRRLRVLDVACGGGHVIMALARRAAAEGVDVEWTGWDTSRVAVGYASTLADRSRVNGVRFEQADALRDPMPAGVDIVVSTLFLHHVTDADAVTLLGRMRNAAARAVVVSDLRRTPLGRLFTWVGCRLLSRSRVFRVDGARSIAAAHTTREARDLARRAGLSGAEVDEVWPQRWLLVWRRPV